MDAHEIRRIYPGHGPVIESPLSKIDEYIHHREVREKQILRALQKQLHKEHLHAVESSWVTSWDLVDIVYGPLALFVKVSAQHNVTHHLHKLQTEGSVVHKWPDMWSARAAADENNNGRVVVDYHK